MSFVYSRENSNGEHVSLSVKQWLSSTSTQMMSLCFASGFIECVTLFLFMIISNHSTDDLQLPSFYICISSFTSAIMISTINIASIHASNNMHNPSARDLANRFDSSAVISYLFFFFGCISFLIFWFNGMKKIYVQFVEHQIGFAIAISIFLLIIGVIICLRTAYLSQKKPIEYDEKNKQQ